MLHLLLQPPAAQLHLQAQQQRNRHRNGAAVGPALRRQPAVARAVLRPATVALLLLLLLLLPPQRLMQGW